MSDPSSGWRQLATRALRNAIQVVIPTLALIAAGNIGVRDVPGVLGAVAIAAAVSVVKTLAGWTADAGAPLPVQLAERAAAAAAGAVVGLLPMDWAGALSADWGDIGVTAAGAVGLSLLSWLVEHTDRAGGVQDASDTDGAPLPPTYGSHFDGSGFGSDTGRCRVDTVLMTVLAAIVLLAVPASGSARAASPVPHVSTHAVAVHQPRVVVLPHVRLSEASWCAGLLSLDFALERLAAPAGPGQPWTEQPLLTTDAEGHRTSVGWPQVHAEIHMIGNGHAAGGEWVSLEDLDRAPVQQTESHLAYRADGLPTWDSVRIRLEVGSGLAVASGAWGDPGCEHNVVKTVPGPA